MLVQDNLSTHKPASLYEPSPARKHAAWSSGSSGTTRPGMAGGSIWPNRELGVLSGQCLDRRIPDQATLINEVAAWQDNRNKNHTKADWQFTTADARVKLNRLYPRIMSDSEL